MHGRWCYPGGPHLLVVVYCRVWWAPWRRRYVIRCWDCELSVEDPVMFWLAELVLGWGFVLGVGGTIVMRELCRRPLARQPVRPVVREPMWEPPPLTRSEWLPTGALIPAEALIPEDDRARAWVADHLMYVYAIVMEDE